MPSDNAPPAGIHSDPADADWFARESLRLLGPEPADWVIKRPGVDHDVAIIGGGQNGIAFAAALRRKGVHDVTIIDERRAEDPNPWISRARMKTLRTAKSLAGPEGEVSALGFRTWYEARHGAAAYDALTRIPRLAWASYVDWYRDFLGIGVRFETSLKRIEPDGDLLRLHLVHDGIPTAETVRKVILATGVDGSGGAAIPSIIADALPASLYAHTHAGIDGAALAGKKVAVIGSAASALDAAATALEGGASEVHLFSRRDALPAASTRGRRNYPGAYENYGDLPDALRWQEGLRARWTGNNPPKDSLLRATAFPNFWIHLSSPLTAARTEEGRAFLTAAGEEHGFDFVVIATGYDTDVTKRPELADVAGQIALWRDRYSPPQGDEDAELARYPYLGRSYEFLEKEAGAAPSLRNIHAFNYFGLLSFGWPVGDLPSLRRGLPTITSAIVRDLFFADLDAHARRFQADAVPEFTIDDYRDRLYREPG